MKALVIDDDVDTIALLAMLLERHGFEVEVASNLADGKAALSKGGHDVLIADFHLPDGEGTSLLLPTRPPSLQAAILVTGAGDDTQLGLARGRGFDDCMVKPVDIHQLLARVDRLLIARRDKA